MNIEWIREAGQRVRPFVKRTPLERSGTLSERLGTNVYVKYELFQKTGSFKVRGAFNKLLSLSTAERNAGVVAVSGGNHAQAVAYAASVLGIDALILMPSNTPSNYLDATRGYGAAVELLPSIGEAFARLEKYTLEGRALVHPFDDDAVIAGQGTVGLEIVEDVPNVTDVVVSIGGGGLAAGVACAVRSGNGSIRIWGVETDGADAMSKAIEAGGPVTIPITSIAKTLGAPYVTEKTLEAVRSYVESVTVVPDAEALRELVFIAERLKVLAEPSASCTLAAAERLRSNWGPSDHVVLIFCGGNVSIGDICGYLSGS